MPNIKIYGLSTQKATLLRKRICIMMQSKGYDDEDAIVTIVQSECKTVGAKGEDAPYIEIVSTRENDFGPIVSGLKELKVGLDIELHPLPKDCFVPANVTE